MPQVLLIEPPGSARDALAFVLRDADIPVEILASARDLPAVFSDQEKTLLLVDESQLRILLPQQHRFHREQVVIWAMLEPGSYTGLMDALQLGATEIIRRDRPARELVALVESELATPRIPQLEDDPDGLPVEFAAAPGRFPITVDRLMNVLEQMCQDIGRLQRRYDAELEQRRKVEAALMESEAFYQSLVQTLPLALFRKDTEGRVTYANQRLCEVLRRNASEILGRTDHDFFPAQLADKYRADDRRVMESGATFETTEAFQTPSGEHRYTHVVKTPVYDTQGLLSGIQGVFFDVTDRVVAETALEQERYLLDSLMTNSPDNIYFKDFQGRYLRINPAKARRSGLRDPSDAIGQSDFNFFPKAHAEAALQDELKVLQTGEALIGKEDLVTYADGTQAWMLTTKLPLKDRQGRVIGTFGVSHDITTQKQAQDAHRRAAEAAEAANRAKSDFLANMSHEIRTPMNAVLGMTELVLGTPLTPLQRDYLKLVHESGESLLSVINDILDFSKIEAGKFGLDHATFEFREFVGDTLKSLGLRAHRKGLELACDIDSNVPDWLIGDANRVRQVIVNLIGNAIKFTEKGEVLVSVERVADSTEVSPYSAAPLENGDSLSDSQEKVVLHFEVSDTGIGIPQEKFKSIFEAFEQADASTTRRFGGTGLGLAISARLVELMGGRIWVESELGRGSTFHFTATFQPSPADERPQSPPSPELLQGLRVLVVDDNSTNRRILAEILTSWGLKPVLMEGATEALEELQRAVNASEPYPLVITDVNMPEKSGFDLVRAAHAQGTLSSGIVVMLTSSDRSDDVEACSQLGVDTYLIKPIKQSELFNAILQALGARHAEEWSAAAMTTARQTSRPLHVLLAEDSTINQKLAVGLLERWGHRVDVAENGRQAIMKSQDTAYDLILMDVQMPEVDGLHATTEIRNREARTGQPRLPIVAMTAHALPGDRQLCLDVGMDDYISKPIRSELLFQLIEQFATASRPPSDSTKMLAAPSDHGEPAPSLPSAASSTTAIAPAPPSPVASSLTDEFSNEARDANLLSGKDLVGKDLVDWAKARQTVGHDDALLRDIAAAYVEESPLIWLQLQQSIDRGDVKGAQRAIHTLKNSLGTFGATTFQQEAFQLEQKLKKTGTIPPLSEFQQVGAAVLGVAAELGGFLRSS